MALRMREKSCTASLAGFIIACAVPLLTFERTSQSSASHLGTRGTLQVRVRPDVAGGPKAGPGVLRSANQGRAHANFISLGRIEDP